MRHILLLLLFSLCSCGTGQGVYRSYTISQSTLPEQKEIKEEKSTSFLEE